MSYHIISYHISSTLSPFSPLYFFSFPNFILSSSSYISLSLSSKHSLTYSLFLSRHMPMTAQFLTPIRPPPPVTNTTTSEVLCSAPSTAAADTSTTTNYPVSPVSSISDPPPHVTPTPMSASSGEEHALHVMSRYHVDAEEHERIRRLGSLCRLLCHRITPHYTM